jgi:hypothetical protein
VPNGATDCANPYDWQFHGRDESVRLFRERLDNPEAKPMHCGKRVFPVLTERHRDEIRGRDPACFCPLESALSGRCVVGMGEPVTTKHRKARHSRRWTTSPGQPRHAQTTGADHRSQQVHIRKTLDHLRGQECRIRGRIVR